jgi:AbrB family looped-hinge helix DNA binding protein
MQTTIRLDNKGRISIPKRLREEAGLEPGDTLFLVMDPETNTLQLRKITNPFDALALHAIQEYELGRTVPLRKIAEEAGIDLDDEEQS